MDWFQRIIIGAFAAIILVTGWMIVEHELETRRAASHSASSTEQLRRQYDQIKRENQRIFSEVIALKDAGDYEGAIEKLRKLIAAHGENAYGYVLLARLEYEHGSITDALHAYRKAVEKDPDYVDKTTPLFIGNEIMDVITRSRAKVNRERKLRPGDQKIRTAINDIYYLQRRIAGGCE